MKSSCHVQNGMYNRGSGWAVWPMVVTHGMDGALSPGERTSGLDNGLANTIDEMKLSNSSMSCWSIEL